MAPDFTASVVLPDLSEQEFCLYNQNGKNVVLYFYPKDNTPGCTTQAIDFSGLIDQFEKHNAMIVGVSKDSAKAHSNFITKHNLKIPLIIDNDETLMKLYDVWHEKKLYGRTFMGVERSTFLIDADRNIMQAWRKVRVKGHAESVLECLSASQS